MAIAEPRPARKLPWEMEEILGWACVVALFSVTAGSVAFGILNGTSQSGPVRVSVGYALEEATLWASAFTALLPLAALGLMWWQARGWADVVIEHEDDAELRDAQGHLRRALVLIAVAGVALVVVAAAAVGQFVGSLIVFSGGIPGADVWGTDLQRIGNMIGAVVLCGAAAFCAQRLRSQITEQLGG